MRCRFSVQAREGNWFVLVCSRCNNPARTLTAQAVRQCGGQQLPVRQPASAAAKRERRPAGGIRQGACQHLGAATGERQCASCRGGGYRIKVFACALHVECTIGKQLPGIACCASCSHFAAAGEAE